MKPIFITGYMCSGKTTFGSALAMRLEKPFIDLDHHIVESSGKTIPELFHEFGENGFRQLEREALLEVSEKSDCIIACGGGTPCFFDNMTLINNAGYSVYLKTSTDTLLRRLLDDNGNRPIVANKSPEEINSIILNQISLREPFYLRSSIIWSGESLDTEDEIIKNVCDFISLNPRICI